MKKSSIASWSGQQVVHYVTHELRQHAAVACGYSEVLLKDDSFHDVNERRKPWVRRLHEELLVLRALVDVYDTWGKEHPGAESLDEAKIHVLHEHIAAYLRTHAPDQNGEGCGE